MKVILVNYRKDRCQLTGKTTNCVDVKSADIDLPLITVDVKKLPELIANVAFQSQLATATRDASDGEEPPRAQLAAR